MSKRTGVYGAWQPGGEIFDAAKAIVESYDTGVTLRQLYYRLVARGLIANRRGPYQYFSHVTAEGRRDGTFPELLDKTSVFERLQSFDGPAHAKRWLARRYHLDRTEGQENLLVIAVEKAGLVEQLWSWFGHLGYPIIALGGFASHTDCKRVSDMVEQDGRDAILLYAGDHDFSGHANPGGIEADFIRRTDCWSKTIRIGLEPWQVRLYKLAPNIVDKRDGKKDDPRKKTFVAQYHSEDQYEVDAIEPEELKMLYQSSISTYHDSDIYDRVIRRETKHRKELSQ